MENLSSVIHARVEHGLKQDAQKIFDQVGLTMSDAIKLFLSQVRLHKGLPFEVKIPNRETKKALNDSINRKNLTKYASIDELFDKLK